jgi:hypothetical protein
MTMLRSHIRRPHTVLPDGHLDPTGLFGFFHVHHPLLHQVDGFQRSHAPFLEEEDGKVRRSSDEVECENGGVDEADYRWARIAQGVSTRFRRLYVRENAMTGTYTRATLASRPTLTRSTRPMPSSPVRPTQPQPTWR